MYFYINLQDLVRDVDVIILGFHEFGILLIFLVFTLIILDSPLFPPLQNAHLARVLDHPDRAAKLQNVKGVQNHHPEDQVVAQLKQGVQSVSLNQRHTNHTANHFDQGS